jgi:hypothetical protein
VRTSRAAAIATACVLVAALLTAAPAAADAVRWSHLDGRDSGKIASGLSSSVAGSNLKRTGDLTQESWWGNDSSWNRYAYVRNNPLNMVDPTGEAGKEVADWISARVTEAVDWYAENVNDDSLAGAVVNDAAVVAGELVAGTGDLLRVGDSTGTAIGEGKSGEDLVLAASQDVGRGSGLALMMAVPANAALKSGGAAAGDVPASTPVGRARGPLDVAPGTNAPAEINGIRYTGHALDRMQGRGLTPSVVENTISTGSQTAGRGGATVYSTSEARVILNPNGSVKTVMPQ